MRGTWWMPFAVASLAVGVPQQSIAASPAGVPISANQQTAPERVKLLNGAPGLEAPTLLTIQLEVPPESKCDGLKLGGSVGFSFIVDSAGRPRNVVFDCVLGNGLDYLAAHMMELDRFNPATVNHAAVAIKGAIEMRLQACEKAAKDQSGHTVVNVRLRAVPEQKFELPGKAEAEEALAPIFDAEKTLARIELIGGNVTAPKPMPVPQMDIPYPDQTANSSDRFSLVVDEHGLPRDVEEVSPIKSNDFAEALREVRRYRFSPARKDGMPVPVRIQIEIDLWSI